MPPDTALPTSRLAEFHGVPVAYLAKHLQAMSRAGILVAGPGPRGGYRLARPPADVSVLDVVEAIDGEGPAFQGLEVRRRRPTAELARARTRRRRNCARRGPSPSRSTCSTVTR